MLNKVYEGLMAGWKKLTADAKPEATTGKHTSPTPGRKRKHPTHFCARCFSSVAWSWVILG